MTTGKEKQKNIFFLPFCLLQSLKNLFKIKEKLPMSILLLKKSIESTKIEHLYFV